MASRHPALNLEPFRFHNLIVAALEIGAAIGAAAAMCCGVFISWFAVPWYIARFLTWLRNKLNR